MAARPGARGFALVLLLATAMVLVVTIDPAARDERADISGGSPG